MSPGSRCSSSTRSSCAKRWWNRYQVAAIVERHEKEVRAGEPVEQSSPEPSSPSTASQTWTAEAFEDGGPKHQRLGRRHRAPRAPRRRGSRPRGDSRPEFRHERLPILDRLEGERGEIEPGRPALGSLDQPLDRFGLQPERETVVEQILCLLLRKREVGSTQLEQRRMRAEGGERKTGLAARREHEPESRGGTRSMNQAMLSRAATAREAMEVVENERDLARCCQPVDQSPARHRRRRVVPRPISGEVETSRVGTALRSAASRYDQSTTGSLSPSSRVTHATGRSASSTSRHAPSSVVLPDPAGSGDDGELDAWCAPKPLDEAFARDHLLPARRGMELRHQQRRRCRPPPPLP